MDRIDQSYGSLKTEFRDNGDPEDEFLREVQDDKRETGELFHFYISEAKKIPLLNANAENELGCLIFEGRKILENCKKNGITPPENLDGLVAEAREIMIASNLLLVISIASKHHNWHVKFLDFIQLGNIGLMRAVDKFDYRKGTKLSTYATPRIRQGMLSAYFSQGGEIKIPALLDALGKKIEKFSQAFEKINDRLPSDEEITEGLGRPLKLVRECLEIKNWDFLFLSKNPKEDDNRQLENVLADREVLSPEENAYLEHREEVVGHSLSELADRLEKIIQRRFGLKGKENTLRKIGQDLEMTGEWVRKLQKEAIIQLKNSSRAEELKQFHGEL